MRILASADLHGDRSAYAWLLDIASRTQSDAVVLAGDLLGYPNGYDSVEEAQRADAAAIRAILNELKCPLLYIMGNDDMVELEYEESAVHPIHARRVDLGRFSFVGYRYSLPFMAGIYEKPEEEIRSDLEAIEGLVDSRTVLVTHSPAHGILDTGILDLSAGSLSILSMIQRREPVAHIHGHVHREFGRKGKHFNVAAGGARRAMLIDLNSMKHKVIHVQPDAI